MFDIGMFVVMVRISYRQFAVFWMGLGIVPTDSFLTSKDTIVVIQQFTV